MRCELNLSTLRNRIKEINVIAAVRHIRGQKGTQLYNKLRCIESRDRSPQGVRKDYAYKLVESLCEFNIPTNDLEVMRLPALLPWEGKVPEVIITPLPRHKHTYAARELKYQYEMDIHSITVVGDTHVYCDGSVMDDGRAACGVLVKKHKENGKCDDVDHSLN